MTIKFGRYHGRRCESIYQEDQGYCRWAQDVATENQAVIEFKNSMYAMNMGRRMPRGQEDGIGRKRGKDQR